MEQGGMTAQQILRVTQAFSGHDPFQMDYRQFSDIFEQLRIVQVRWLQRVRGEIVEDNTLYDSGARVGGPPYIKNYVCSEEMQRMIQISPAAGAPPWTQQEMDSIMLFSELNFIYGGNFVMRQLSLDAVFMDRDTHIPNMNTYAKTIRGLGAAGRMDQYAALYMNLKNCKLINKYYGYSNGTKLLAAYAQLCCTLVEPDEQFVRLGGDNFLALIRKENLDRFLEKMRGVKVSLEQDGQVLSYKFCTRAGIYPVERPDATFDILMNNSARALALTRQPPVNDFVFFDAKAEQKLVHMNELEVQMDAAMHRGDFQVFYQPKVATQSRRVVGAEALIRWNYRGRMLSPMEFIPMFERTCFILKADFYMLDRVCAQLRDWLDRGLDTVPISVNFSRAHLMTEQLAYRIQQVVASYDLPTHYIEIEFTETAYFNDMENLARTITELKDYGIAVSMDDFGTGYSSLCLLQDLTFDVIKIDKSLCDASNERKTVVLEHIISMANALKMYVVCEGVESTENFHFLEHTDCDMIQGFLFDRPLQLADFENRLMNKQYHLQDEMQKNT